MVASQFSSILLIVIFTAASRVDATCPYFEEEDSACSSVSARCFNDDDCTGDSMCCPTGCEWGVCEQQPQTEIIIKPTKVEDCGGSKAYIHMVDFVIKRLSKTKSSVKGQVVVDRAWDQNITAELHIWRCADSNNPDTCEHFFSKTYEKFCTLLANKDELWTAVVKRIPTLKPECPVPKGNYTLQVTEVSIDEKTAILPILNGYYIVEGRLLEEKSLGNQILVGCCHLEALLVKEEE